MDILDSIDQVKNLNKGKNKLHFDEIITKLKKELPKFPPRPPANALINPLLFGKYLDAFLTAAVIEMAKPIPKKILIKKSKIKLFEIVNKISPMNIKIPPNAMTILGPK